MFANRPLNFCNKRNNPDPQAGRTPEAQQSMAKVPDIADMSSQQRLSHVVEMMREMSRHTDPQQMVLAYGERVRHLMPYDRLVAVSRRGLEEPWYRVTRSTTWGLDRNPWKEHDRLPVLQSGLLGELLYGDEPRVVDELNVAADDPGAEFLADMGSAIAVPVYDQGMALNMVVVMRREAHAFDSDQLADQVWTSNLFGRSTQTLVLAGEIERASKAIDQELKTIGDLQRSLLPWRLPQIPTMNLAVHYQPAAKCGGDYYDFFPMHDDKWGILIADVSGHGSPAAVLMAITHVLAHAASRIATTPSHVLNYINHHLTQRYTVGTGRFVTAFCGVYDPSKHELIYASAGHNAPRVKRCTDGSTFFLDAVGNPPLGIDAEILYDETTQTFETGDQIIFYTDGITEAFNSQGDMFGTDRLDEVLHTCMIDATGLIDAVLMALDDFTAGHPADDDRTMLVAKVTG